MKRTIFDNLDRQMDAIKPKIEALESPVMKDIANKALSRIADESTTHSFEDEKVRATLFGHPSENIVRVSAGQWRIETKYSMHVMMQRKSDGHVIFTDVGRKNNNARRNSLKEFTGEEIESVQSINDLDALGVTSEVMAWAQSEHLASQVGADRVKRGRVSIDQKILWNTVMKTLGNRASMLIRHDSSNRLLNFKRKHPYGHYGLTDEELPEIEQIPGGHTVLFEFEAMSDAEKSSVDEAVFDIVSNRFHEDFQQITSLKSRWLAERMSNIAPDHALSEDAFETMDLAVANFIVGGKDSDGIRNRLQFAEMFNFQSVLIEDALKSSQALADIDAGRSLREIFAERLGYSSFSKKEFAVMKEYATYKGPFSHGMLLEDAAMIAKLPPEYRPTPENFMLSLGNDFAYLNQDMAKKSLHNACKLLDSGDPADKKDALQSIAWIKGGDWEAAMKKMENHPQAGNLPDYYQMLEQMMSPVFAYFQYQEDPESIDVDYGDMRATYTKPASMNDRTLGNMIRHQLVSFPSVLLMNDKLHKNYNAVTTKYREIGEYSPAKITWTPLFSAPQTIDGITFVALSSGSDIIAEGSQMRHCVASYLQPAMAGESYIVSVQKNGEKCSTLELVIGDDNEWEISQHFGPGNSTVPAELEDAAFELLDKIESGEINVEPDTGMREELKDMDPIRASALVEGFDFTNREVVSGLFKEALNYLPKGVGLDDLFLELEKEWLDEIKDFIGGNPEEVTKTNQRSEALTL